MRYDKVITDFVMDSVVLPLWPTEDISGLTFQVQFAGHEFVGPRYYVSRKGFDSFLMAFTPKGHTNILVDGEPFCADEGTLIFYDCTREFNSTTDTPTAPLSFSAELIYLHLYPNEMLKNFCSVITQNGPVVRLGEDDCGFKSLVFDLLEQGAKGKIDETEFSCRIYETLCRIKNKILVTDDRLSPTVQSVKRFISTHYTEKLTIADCARFAHLSPNHLESLFSREVGAPIASYIAAIRFHKSADLLVNTDMSLSEIAEAVGLYDSRSLIRLYKKKSGLTPLAYRKLNRSRPNRSWC